MIKVLVGFFLGLAIAGACAQIVPAITCMTPNAIVSSTGTTMTYVTSAVPMVLQSPAKGDEPYRSPWGGAWPSERRADR